MKPTTAVLSVWFLLAAGVLLAPTARAQSGGVPPTEARFTFEPNGEGVRGLQMEMFVKADPDRVWKAVTSPAKAPWLFKDVKRLVRSDQGGLWDYHLRSPLGDKVVTCKLRRNDRGRELHWKRVSGDLSHMSGYIKVGVDPRYPEHARVRYASFIDPGALFRALMTNAKRQRTVEFTVDRIRTLGE